MINSEDPRQGLRTAKKITISVLGEKKSHIPWEEKNASSNSISNEMYIQGIQDKKESSWVFHMVHRNSWINHEDHKITMRKKLQYFWPVFFSLYFFLFYPVFLCPSMFFLYANETETTPEFYYPPKGHEFSSPHRRVTKKKKIDPEKEFVDR